MTEIRSYGQANEYLGKKDSRPIRYKTRVNRRGENIAITYHYTDVITYQPDGVVVVDPCGYHTVTTKDRLNNHLPGEYPNGFRVYQEDSIWYLLRGKRYIYDPETARSTKNKNLESLVFKDGMRILPNGTVEGAGPPAEELKKPNKEILKYSRDYIKALFAGEVPKPSGGDCWYCGMITTGKETLGEATGSDHLLSHFEEKYYVPSLLVRAIEVFPVSKAATWALGDFWGEGMPLEDQKWFYDVAKQQLKSSLKRYLRRQLGLAS